MTETKETLEMDKAGFNLPGSDPKWLIFTESIKILLKIFMGLIAAPFKYILAKRRLLPPFLFVLLGSLFLSAVIISLAGVFVYVMDGFGFTITWAIRIYSFCVCAFGLIVWLFAKEKASLLSIRPRFFRIAKVAKDKSKQFRTRFTDQAKSINPFVRPPARRSPVINETPLNLFNQSHSKSRTPVNESNAKLQSFYFITDYLPEQDEE